eukprot:9049573-Ditylum_brightwellii.AAC.1
MQKISVYLYSPGLQVWAMDGIRVEEQHNIGWHNFARGQILKKWGDAQQLFYHIFYNNVRKTT